MVPREKRHITSLSWCGIFVLCLAICFQLLGVPGTLFNFADSEDDFQASVMLGYTIIAAAVSLLPWLKSLFGSIEITVMYHFVPTYTMFHPPVSLASL